MHLFCAKLRTFFSSNLFFYIALLVLGASAVWIAVSSLYPMAFDEEFHFGLIKLYAEHLLPHTIQNTSELATFGIAGADPSYLFHYVMSFPYRLLSAVGLSEQVTIIVLRFINIAMIVTALFVYRATLLKFGVSKAIAQLSIVLVTLLPIVPVMAGQINYDNALLLIVAGCSYFVATMCISLKNSGILPLKSLLLFCLIGLIGTATKYAFIPLLAGMIITVLIVIASNRKKIEIKANLAQFKLIRTPIIAIILVLIVVAGALNARYITNLVSYSTPLPSCDQVFDEVACEQYGPWNRDNLLAANRPASFSALSYPEYITTHFLPGLSMRLTFAVAGPTNDYQTKSSLPLLEGLLILLTVIGLICFIVSLLLNRPLNHNILILYTALTILCYVIPLSFTLYKSYVATSQPVAINGRYLLPLLPFVAAVLIQSIQRIAPSRVRSYMPLATIVLIGVLFLLGGGVSTYIVQSETHWYWGGFGQSSHEIFKTILEQVIIRIS